MGKFNLDKIYRETPPEGITIYRMMSAKDKEPATLTRRDVLKYGLYGGAAVGISAGLAKWGYSRLIKQKKYNVVLIVLDTARADRFSFMGYNRNTSPNIDSLASESVIYSSAFAPCFWTLPSHASLFTGLFPGTAGATSQTNHLPYFNTTLAEVLKNTGFHTAGLSCNVWVSHERGFTKGFDEYYEMWRKKNYSVVNKQSGQMEWEEVKKVNQWVDSNKKSVKPFFLFVNLNCVHMPYTPPEPFRSRFLKNKDDLSNIRGVSRLRDMWAHLAGEIKLSEKDTQIMSDLYDGEVAFADHCVGEIVKTLKEAGQFDNTLFIVTSDHGENLGDHNLLDHLLSMYETTLHIPLLIRYPESYKAGTTFDGLVSLVDVAPAILDVCDICEDNSNTKQSVAALTASGISPRKFIVAENERPINGLKIMRKKFPSFDTKRIDYPMQAIRTDKHKFIWSIGYKRQLYDLTSDPKELKNIAVDNPKLADKLQARLIKWNSEIPAAKDISFMAGKDRQSLAILRSMGYIE